MTKLPLPRPTPLIVGVAREMDEMQNRLRRVFDEGFPMVPMMEPLGWVPVVEILETPEELLLTAELPGMALENIELTFEDDVLILGGEKKEEVKEGDDRRFHVWERKYGAFRRAFTLPRTIDPEKIVAEFKEGVLNVHMPKTALAKARGHKITIAKK